MLDDVGHQMSKLKGGVFEYGHSTLCVVLSKPTQMCPRVAVSVAGVGNSNPLTVEGNVIALASKVQLIFPWRVGIEALHESCRFPGLPLDFGGRRLVGHRWSQTVHVATARIRNAALVLNSETIPASLRCCPPTVAGEDFHSLPMTRDAIFVGLLDMPVGMPHLEPPAILYFGSTALRARIDSATVRRVR